MKKFSFGKKSFPLNFVIEEDKIYLYDEIPVDSGLNKDQEWVFKHSAFICEVQISGEATTIHSGDRYIGCSESNTLRYVKHKIHKYEDGRLLEIIQRNDKCEVTSYYREYDEAKTIQCYSKIKNISNESFYLEYISSFVKYGITGFNRFDSATLSVPSNSWFMECQWKKNTFQHLGIISPNLIKTFKAHKVSNTGMWSTKNYLPMGLIQDKKYHQNILFQIEANGSWNYEVGDFTNTITLNLSGPSLQENGWMKKLEPNEEFVSVKCAITSAKKEEDVFVNMTRYRRKIVTRKNDAKDLPVIFNEYMFASWNDPSYETASLLAPVSKKLGADYFVIDCGWHDEEPNPFYHVGKWNESKTKYPDGLIKTLDFIRSQGLKVGLWLEPEVVGYLGDAKNLWNDDCFFQRNGKPLIVSNRYQLDFRNPKVYNYLLNKIDDICNKYHVDYFKFDYNIEPGMGTDLNSDSLGDGLLENNRMYHQFIDELGARHPDLVIESCASGGNRLDYLTLDNVNLVSTSDQTNYALYPYIVANILTAVLPEQAGIWSYPRSEHMKDEDMDNECIAMNMINSMIGRVHLASKLYLLNENQQKLIKEGIDVYKYLVQYRDDSVPFYPRGLANYGDKHLVFGYRSKNKIILFVYNMHGTDQIKTALKNAKNVKLLYPLSEETNYEFINQKLVINPHREKIARVFEIDF